jgi:50S ribosomal protein L16 3-hydroxylase
MEGSTGYIKNFKFIESFCFQKSQALKFEKSPIASETSGWNSTFYATFLEKYWQKKPILIRNAFPSIYNDIALREEDFFAMACDDDVDSRLFVSKRNKTEKSYGPFTIEELTQLPRAGGWSILLQEVDRHIPKVADLWTRGFNFLPKWRRDDIMFSYSMVGGTIGAHVDNYDVFLIQGR